MWRTLCLCVFMLAARAESDERESKLVETSQGAVRGYKDPENGIYAFQSIPYATAPTGPNRYMAPLPAPVWLQPLEATDKGIMCPQASFPMAILPTGKTMQEDCLLASVYTPDTDEKNLPVLVNVHGGAFQLGLGDWLQSTKLVSEHKIIMVTFNYRLGIHGFLCLGTEDVPGNAGMKDQVALLRWVKKNIASFGGNPNDVTIRGSSAGSAAVDLLMLSKAAQGLFTKVIPESGGNIAAFTIQPDPIESAKYFANVLNFTNVDDIYALEQFYKTTSLEELMISVFFDRPDSTFVFSPCVERPSTDAFLDESPVSIMKDGRYKKVPLLYGFANMEGLLRIGFFDFWKEKMNEMFSDFLPADLKFENEDQKQEVAKVVKEFYFGNKPIEEDSVLSYVDYFTDVMFAYPMLLATKLQVEDGHDQIYLYEYSYVDENTPVVPYTNVRGANHCAQTTAVDEQNIPGFFDNSNSTEEFKLMSSRMRQLWVNFIKTGKPVPEESELSLPPWPAVRGDWAPHMSLGNEFQLRGSLLEHRARFWDDIYAKHYKHPVSPPAPATKHSEL